MAIWFELVVILSECLFFLMKDYIYKISKDLTISKQQSHLEQISMSYYMFLSILVRLTDL